MPLNNTQFLQFISTSYTSQSLEPVLGPPVNRQLMVYNFSAINNSGATIQVGMGTMLAPEAFKLYDSDANLLPSDDPGAIFTTTDGEGFYVQARKRFNGLSFLLSDFATGSPTYVVQYWNGGWQTLITYSGANFAGSESSLHFAAPLDWAQGSGGVLPAISTPANPGYTIRVLATNAPDAPISAVSLSVMVLHVVRQSVGPGQWLEVGFADDPMLLEGLEALVPYFSVANAANQVEVAYRVLL